MSIVARAVIETALLYLVLIAAAMVQFGASLASIEQQKGPLGPRALLFSLVMLLSFSAFGLHSGRQRARSAGIFVRIVAAVGLGVVICGICMFLIPNLSIGRGVVVLAGSGAVAVALMLHVALAQLMDERVFKARVLVYGVGRSAEAIAKLRRRTDRRGFTIVGFVAPEGESFGAFLSGEAGVPSEGVLDGAPGLLELCRHQDVDEIVVAVDDRRRNFPIRELLECRLAGVDVTELLTFLERESGRVPIDVLNPSWIIFGQGYRRGSLRRLSARALDLIASIILMVVSFPALIATVIAIKVEDGLRAPVLYRQERVGFGGRVFQLLKFRSMRVDAETPGEARWAVKDDPRVTRVGAVIRTMRVDELPQILNVLRGDMSLVGPRPERPEFVARLSQKIPYDLERHCLKPGITGWAQLCYPYGSSEQDAMEKLQYDLYYIKNNSLLLDLVILVQTAEVMVFGKGAR